MTNYKAEDNFKYIYIYRPFSALQNFKAGSYDIVLIDLILAKTYNNEVYKKIVHMDERVKICYMSGIYQNYEEIEKYFLSRKENVLFLDQLKHKFYWRK